MSRRLSRKSLTKTTIVTKALYIADQSGLEVVSMRRLGSELGVEAMALYHYYTNKAALLEDMLDAVHVEITTAPIEVSWQEAVRIRAQSVLDVLAKHPWAATIMESGVNPGPSTMQDRETMTHHLRKAGFSIENTVHAITLLDIYIYGAAQQYVKLSFTTPKQAAQISESVAGKFQPDEYPYFHEVLINHILAGKYDPIKEFHFGLELVISSIEKLR